MKREKEMEPIDLSPYYSTRELPSRCVRCLAEQKLNNCIFELLGTPGEDEELKQRFEALRAFLQSPASKSLLDESEKHLADGKQVEIQLSFEDNQPKFELKITD